MGLKEITENANHAAILTVMLDELMKDLQLELQTLDAIAISAGPGSFTGLRIGAATAKGLCYALSKPLITIDSLQSLAFGLYKKHDEASQLYCPTIDARRNEIYYGLFGENAAIIKASSNTILHPEFLQEHNSVNILIGGSGAIKCKSEIGEGLIKYDLTTLPSSQWMVALAEKKFHHGDYADYVSFEPNYVKPAYVTDKKHK